MTILLDMNLSPLWVPFFEQGGIAAVHWSTVGSPDALDATILGFAAAHGHVLMTHDLDFGAMMATSGKSRPSVIQVRSQDVLPNAIGEQVMRTISAMAAELELGAIVTVAKERGRARLLPFPGRKP